MKKRLQITLDENTAKLLAIKAANFDISKSKLIQELIEREIIRYEPRKKEN